MMQNTISEVTNQNYESQSSNYLIQTQTVITIDVPSHLAKASMDIYVVLLLKTKDILGKAFEKLSQFGRSNTFIKSQKPQNSITSDRSSTISNRLNLARQKKQIMEQILKLLDNSRKCNISHQMFVDLNRKIEKLESMLVSLSKQISQISNQSENKIPIINCQNNNQLYKNNATKPKQNMILCHSNQRPKVYIHYNSPSHYEIKKSIQIRPKQHHKALKVIQNQQQTSGNLTFNSQKKINFKRQINQRINIVSPPPYKKIQR